MNWKSEAVKTIIVNVNPGFMQDTFFTCYKFIEMCFITWNKLQTHPFSRHNCQYIWFFKTFFGSFFLYPPSNIPTHSRDGWMQVFA